MSITVSILVPVYNREKFLPQLIASVKKQTYTNYELVLVNDASTDNSLAVMQQLAKEFPQLKIITYTENKRAAAARNVGLKQCQGEYICLLDSDDLLEPTALEKGINYLLNNPAIDGVIFDELKVDTDLKPKYMLLKLTEDYYIKKQNLFRTSFGGAATIIKKDKFFEAGLYDERMTASNDRCLSLAMHNLLKIDGIPERLYLYREHNQNITKINHGFKTTPEYQKILQAYRQFITKDDYLNDWDQVKRFKTLEFDYKKERHIKYANVILKCALKLAQMGDKKAALTELKKAEFVHPSPKYTVFKLFIALGFKNYLDKLYINMNAMTNYAYDDFYLVDV